MGGFSSLVQNGVTRVDRALLGSRSHVLSTTDRLCASVAVASTRSGINVEACLELGRILRDTAQRTS